MGFKSADSPTPTDPTRSLMGGFAPKALFTSASKGGSPAICNLLIGPCLFMCSDRNTPHNLNDCKQKGWRNKLSGNVMYDACNPPRHHPMNRRPFL